MKVIQIQQYGDASCMALVDLATPTPKADELLITIKACGVNFIDVYQRSGLYKNPLPFTLGKEGAGIVEEVGQDVTEFNKGDRVAWANVPGSYATHVIAKADDLVLIPEKVDFQKAAAAMLQGMTAHYLASSTYPIQAGDTCLIHAAAGGVGLLLCQVAKMRGAKIIGTVSTNEKAMLAKKAGADEIILYTEQDFETEVKKITNNQGVQVVYDSVGQTTFEKSLNCLKPRGYMVSFGQSSGPVSPIDPLILNAKGAQYLTRPSLHYYIATQDELLKRAHDVFSWIEQGQLTLRIDNTYPIADVSQAHADLEARKTIGKILLLP